VLHLLNVDVVSLLVVCGRHFVYPTPAAQDCSADCGHARGLGRQQPREASHGLLNWVGVSVPHERPMGTALTLH
jgi:hypothetical protein